MNLQHAYKREDFIKFVQGLVPGFAVDSRSASATGLQVTEKITYLGESRNFDLSVFEITHASTKDARVKLAMDGFRVMKANAVFRALIIYHSDRSDDWRLSLMTATLAPDQKGRVAQTFSNPRRFSFFLGPNAKTNTPQKFLIKQGSVKDFEDLQKRFSLEVVNKEFYKGISESFTKLVGGTLGAGKNKKTYEPVLRLPSNASKNQNSMEFGVRLIGRIIFCWFLREKKGQNGIALMPRELLSSDAVRQWPGYYHTILEPIFFEVLNKEHRGREEKWVSEPFSYIPYLNGGLFSPQYEDYYDLDRGILVSRHINTLVIPDSWFEEFFNILESYNFTIDENTSFDEELSIDPEMLGRIFENLLAEINPETGESARKSTGSFYTPRTIVDYMVDESLLLFLKQKTGITEDKLRVLISYDLTDDERHTLNDSEKQKVIDALDQLKLLDPACGSGAFPIGALQKIVFILQRVDSDAQLWFAKQIASTAPEIRRVIEREFKHKNFDYIRKLGVIRENIYGIDIQPIAIEISRLRCFLTLVVDERVDDTLENRGIEPLPNLDFKFVAANSLVGLKSEQIITGGLFKDEEGIARLKVLREKFFNATNSERYRLKSEFSEIQKQMLFRMIQMASSDDLTQKLSMWDPFGNKVSTWFDPEWMFGIKDGFDVVIANPPYLQIQKLNEHEKELYMSFSTFTKSGDLYCLFFERSIRILADNGIVTFITSNSWLKTIYGESLRKFLLANSNPSRLINFEDARMFEQAIVETSILISTKSQWNKQLMATTMSGSDAHEQPLDNYIRNNHFVISNLEAGGWIIADKDSSDLKKKAETGSVRLKDFGVVINFGVKTGLNEAFIIRRDKKEELVSKNPKSAEIIKSLLRGRDVHKWAFEFSDVWLINAHNGLRKEKLERVDVVNEYPAIYEHLLEFQSKLEKRTDQGSHWTNLRDCAYLNEFSKEKIIWGELSDRPKFAYDQDGHYAEATLFFMTGPSLKYLLAILNSKISEWYFNQISTSSGMGTNRWKKYKIEQLPIKKISNEDQKPFVELVDKILEVTQDDTDSTTRQSKLQEYEKQIDILAYKLYGLTPDEIKIVES